MVAVRRWAPFHHTLISLCHSRLNEQSFRLERPGRGSAGPLSCPHALAVVWEQASTCSRCRSSSTTTFPLFGARPPPSPMIHLLHHPSFNLHQCLTVLFWIAPIIRETFLPPRHVPLLFSMHWRLNRAGMSAEQCVLRLHRENYIHRIGRSGRFGRKGVAINFVTAVNSPSLRPLRVRGLQPMAVSPRASRAPLVPPTPPPPPLIYSLPALLVLKFEFIPHTHPWSLDMPWRPFPCTCVARPLSSGGAA